MGDEDSLWRYTLIIPGRAPIEETSSDAMTPEGVAAVFEDLWERVAEFDDPAPNFEEILVEVWPIFMDSKEEED